MNKKPIFAPAHLKCVNGRIRNKINGGRAYQGPSELADADGHIWAIDGQVAPNYSGACAFCGLRVDAKRPWEAVLVTRDPG